MVEILLYLARSCFFLFRPGWFRIVDSRVNESSGGDAMLVLESQLTRLRFTWDKAQLLMEFQPINGKPGDWYSNGLLSGFLIGDRGGSEVLNEEWAGFLRWAIEEFETRLTDPDSAEEMLHGLRKQARLRAKELFG